jgi:hypothetical protein
MLLRSESLGGRGCAKSVAPLVQLSNPLCTLLHGIRRYPRGCRSVGAMDGRVSGTSSRMLGRISHRRISLIFTCASLVGLRPPRSSTKFSSPLLCAISLTWRRRTQHEEMLGLGPICDEHSRLRLQQQSQAHFSSLLTSDFPCPPCARQCPVITKTVLPSDRRRCAANAVDCGYLDIHELCEDNSAYESGWKALFNLCMLSLVLRSALDPCTSCMQSTSVWVAVPRGASRRHLTQHSHQNLRTFARHVTNPSDLRGGTTKVVST